MTGTTPGDLRARARRAWLFALALVLVAALWELYKLVGPQDGGEVLGWSILPRANDQAMPHVWEMLSRYAEPERRGSDVPILFAVAVRSLVHASGSPSRGSRWARWSGSGSPS